MKKFLATLLAAAMLCTAIAVPAVAESTEAAQETAAVTEFPRNETLYYFSGMGVLPSSFNPFVSSGGEWPAGQMQYLLYEALFMMNMNTGELEPLLADSYEVQDDNSVIVKINEAAHFNDGSALTAADVKFSYDLGQKYSLQYSSYWDNIASVEIVDDYTIQIFQKEDAVNTPVVLDSMQMVPIVPEAIWGPIAEEAGDDVSVLRAFDNLEAPVGSGCYKVYGFNDQGIYLERDDNYWGVARFGSLPNPKYIVQPIYTSNNGVAEALVAGDLDMAQAYISQIWNLQEQNPDIKTYIEQSKGFDPENKYSIPYCWGTVGILYNKTMIEEGDTVDSWEILWDEKYKDNILMQDSVRDAFMVTEKLLGYDINTTNEEELKACADKLIEQKPLVQAYVIDQVRDKMIGGEAALGVIYSGEAIYTQRENEDLEYVIPKEGTNVWIDSWVIPKNAQNVENAEIFLDFLCRADIALKNFDYITYSTPNKAARELIEDEEIRNSTIAFPTAEMLANSNVFNYIGEEGDALYEEYWSKVKSS